MPVRLSPNAPPFMLLLPSEPVRVSFLEEPSRFSIAVKVSWPSPVAVLEVSEAVMGAKELEKLAVSMPRPPSKVSSPPSP
jgi:hypothetical protein